MSELDPEDSEAALENIRKLAATDALRVTQHAQLPKAGLCTSSVQRYNRCWF